MRLGIPDDYAEAFLADILGRFNRAHPLVEVSVACENSHDLAAQVEAGALELALVTDFSGLPGFEVLREQPLVWAAAKRFQPEAGAPVPLALGSAACLWRKVAEEALREGATAGARSLFLEELQRDRLHRSAAAWRRRRCRFRWSGAICGFSARPTGCRRCR